MAPPLDARIKSGHDKGECLMPPTHTPSFSSRVRNSVFRILP
jgi:hypothetical protein